MIVVTAAIIEKDGLVLAARRGKGKHLAGYWEFPGGKLKKGESPERCLARELKEEFDVETSVGPIFAENTHKYDEKTIRLLAYLVTHNKGNFKLIDHDKLLWLAPEDLSTVNWAPADIPLVEKYQLIKSTQSYYSKNAQAYAAETISLDLSEQYQPFLTNLKAGGHILEMGCGSGRDSCEFIHC